jgi:hypothetical protein
MGEETASPIDWPLPWDTGAPMPFVLAADRTFLVYYASKIMPNYDKSRVKLIGEVDSENLVALVEFLACYDLKFGGPNDEVFHGHPLYGKGLELYDAHIVENSKWLAEAEQTNKVHTAYDPDHWGRFKHYLLMFHDERFECLAKSFYIEVYSCSFDKVLEVAMDRITGTERWLKNSHSTLCCPKCDIYLGKHVYQNFCMNCGTSLKQ